MSETTIAPTTDNADSYQPDEVVDVQLRGVRVAYTHQDDFVFYVEIPQPDGEPKRSQVWLNRHQVGLNITRSQPADGIPRPGELWSTQSGKRLFSFGNENSTTWLMDPTSGRGEPWRTYHTGPDGPIRRIATVDELGALR